MERSNVQTFKPSNDSIPIDHQVVQFAVEKRPETVIEDLLDVAQPVAAGCMDQHEVAAAEAINPRNQVLEVHVAESAARSRSRDR